MTELAKRPVDRLEQVVGAVIRHFHVGVANHPEQVRVGELDAGEELTEVRANDVLEKREGRARTHRAAGAPASGMKRGSSGGILTRANLFRRPWRTTTAKFWLRFEMNGKGWPGSNASGVNNGKISAGRTSER